MTPSPRADSGFTMMEALLAILLLGFIMGSLAVMTSQWLRNWNRGFNRLQGAEILAAVTDRITSDIAAAQFVSANGAAIPPTFDGLENGFTFVRSAIGPNDFLGLEVVQIGMTAGNAGAVLSRSTAPFLPGQSIERGRDNYTTLLGTPYRATFAYADGRGDLQDTWRNRSELPRAIRISITDGGSLNLITTARVRSELPALCSVTRPPASCLPAGEVSQSVLTGGAVR